LLSFANLDSRFFSPVNSFLGLKEIVSSDMVVVELCY